MKYKRYLLIQLYLLFFGFCPIYAQYFIPDIPIYPAPMPYVDPSMGIDPYTTAEMNRIMTDLVTGINEISNPNKEYSFKSPITSRIIRTKLQNQMKIITFDDVNWIKFTKYIGEVSPTLMTVQSEDDPNLVATFRTHTLSSSITISNHGNIDVYYLLGSDGQIIDPGPINSNSGSSLNSSYQKQQCTVCHGSGLCPLCKGSGRSTSPTYGIGSPGPCNYCGGGGKCPKCHGSR